MHKVIIATMFIFTGLPAQVDFDTEIQPLFGSNCAIVYCHGSNAGGLDLTTGNSYNQLVDVESHGYAPALRVASGDPVSSVLYDKISGGGNFGQQMPQGAPPLSDANIALVETWIMELSMTDTSIYDIQSGVIAEGTIVSVIGVVTAGSGETPDGSVAFYIQDGSGEYSGINVYISSASNFSVNRGDSIQVTGEYVEYFGKTEITNVTDITTFGTNVSLPAAEELTLNQLDWEPWEGVLVKIENVTVINDSSGFGEWEVSDGVDTLMIDNAGNYSYSPSNGEFINAITGPLNYTYSNYKMIPRDDDDIVIDPAPDLVINEFLASSDQCCPDGNGEMEDFIEIYNPGTAAVDIGGLWITDNLDDPSNWEQIPATDSTTTTVAAGGHIVIWADEDQSTQGILHTSGFQLSSGGEDIGLIYISGTDTVVVDSLTFGSQTADVSYGRYPDGSDNWQFFVSPTPGAANSAGAVNTSIYNIQYVSDPLTDDASPLVGQEVIISGVVTAEFWGSSSNRYFHVQDAAGPWNGIVCFEYDGWDTFDFTSPAGTVHSLAEGDSVTVTGTVEEYNNLTEITDVSEVFIHGPAAVMIPPSIIAVIDIGEAYEGCLVEVNQVYVSDPDLGFGEWEFADSNNYARCDDKWDYYYFPEADEVIDIIGVLDYSFENYKLQPRLARDIVEIGWVGGAPTNPTTRIQRIQQVLYSDLLKAGEDEESDISYMFEDTVTVEGIVTMPTGLSFAGTGVKFIFQDEHGGPWSSILSYDPDSSAFPILYEGDRIIITGYVFEYSTGPANMTELFITEPINILSVGEALPEVELVETGDLRWPTTAEQWGNVIVRIEDGTITGNDFQYEIFEVDDGSGGVLVDDDSDSIATYFDAVGPPPVGSLVSSLEGWVYHHYGIYSDSSTYKLEPLYVSDIEFGAGPPIISDVSRNPCVPDFGEDVTVSAVIIDNSTVATAEVFYSIDGGEYQSLSMTLGADDTWSGTIISATDPTGDAVLYYYISATDDGVDQNSVKTNTYPYDIEADQLGYYISPNQNIDMVQETDWPSGNSLYNGCEVTVTGIITADTAQYRSSYGAYAFQSEAMPWSGIVFDGWDESELIRGDEVTITGRVEEYDPAWHSKYDNNTKLIDISAVTINSSGNTLSSLSVSTADLTQDGDEVESYEGCLVAVTNVTVSTVNQYDWFIMDGSGVECLIDDDMATTAANSFMSNLEEGQTLTSVTGIFNFSFGTYKIQVRDLGDLGTLGIDDDFSGLSREFALYPNYPNPFNPETRIHFQLAEQSDVKVVIYDVLGRNVRTLIAANMDAGYHVVNWDGLNAAGIAMATGMYIFRIKAGNFIAHRKMLLIR